MAANNLTKKSSSSSSSSSYWRDVLIELFIVLCDIFSAFSLAVRICATFAFLNIVVYAFITWHVKELGNNKLYGAHQIKRRIIFYCAGRKAYGDGNVCVILIRSRSISDHIYRKSLVCLFFHLCIYFNFNGRFVFVQITFQTPRLSTRR